MQARRTGYPRWTFLAQLAAVLLLAAAPAAAERIKDIASVAGVRTNQLVGYGLVVGLDGTGDQTSQTPFTVQSLKNMLNQYGITLPPNVNPQLKNVAAVTIQADLPHHSTSYHSMLHTSLSLLQYSATELSHRTLPDSKILRIAYSLISYN